MIRLDSDGAMLLDISGSSVIRDRILLSLFTPRGSLFQAPGFGSLLHTLRRARAGSDLPSQAIQMVQSSLKWMVDQGMIWGLSVESALVDRSRLSILISSQSIDGEISLDSWIPVSEAGA